MSSSRLDSRMSRHILGSLAAMRVKSRNPGPASDRNSSPCDCPVMLFIIAKASTWGRWLTAAKAASWDSGDMLLTRQPRAFHIVSARCS
ncbi:hypothetical protein D3C71_1881790 [compost metagenome]